MDARESLLETVRDAAERKKPLTLNGGGSKAFLGHASQGEAVDVSVHRGIVDYDPAELVVTCRAGTRLSDISELLAENGQHLPFEPPAFGNTATIGGTVACGLSGPRRPWAGSLRDYLLGVRLINGRGQEVRFGGQVMKNVAGYDVSRLMAGAMGTLGVLLELSFKVLPKPARELTLEFEGDEDWAIRQANRWSARPLPLSGAFWQAGRLWVRLSGARTEIERAAGSLRAQSVREDPELWRSLREHQLPFFRHARTLWRISLPPTAPPPDLGQADHLLDWGGAQRWYDSALPAGRIFEAASALGGHATMFRGETDGERFQPLPAPLRGLHERIRKAFDPHGIFNPGRRFRES